MKMSKEQKLDDIMGVLRTFVCNVGPNSLTKERYLPITYGDAVILVSEVSNLRISLAQRDILVDEYRTERDELLATWTEIVDKLASIDPLWNEKIGKTPCENALAFIDMLMRSAGVLRDDPAHAAALELRAAADYIAEEQERHRLYVEQVKEDMGIALAALERVLPQAQGALVIQDIKHAVERLNAHIEGLVP